MAAENKQFLDKIGVQYLWDKINEYFSQIGHRHETSDVNGLDEYMEENAKAIRDTEKVIEILPTLPLYPSEEQLGIIYACNGRLYRGKKLPKLVLDFSQIEDDGEGNVTQEIIRDFINKNGKNIVMEYYDGEDTSDFYIDGDYFETYNNGLYIDNHLYFQFERRNNSETFDYFNRIYVKSMKITAQSPYNEDNEEVWQGCVDYFIDDRGGVGTLDSSFFLNDDYPPTIETKTFNFGQGEQIILADYISLSIEDNGEPFTLLKLELELVTCNSPEDYEEGIFHDFLVWEEISEEELPIEDTTPATEDTRKRFYREIENNNIYVTDTEYNPGASGFVIDIVHPKTGGQINDDNELRGYIDPNQVWTNGVNGVEQIYADNRYWLNELGERVTITPIRMGTNKSSASIYLSTKTDVDLYFSPYISMSYPSQEAVIEQDYTTIEVNDAVAGETNEYEVELFDNINLLNEKWTIVHVPISTEVYINTSRRCYLHKIVKKGEGEGDRYYWSQIAKMRDIEDKINALPEVARTGSYTDLFNKPCIGNVQTYDWPNDEDLPIIEEGQTDSCENRLKQLLRLNNSLYTAVQNESGLSLDLRQFSRDYKTQGYCGNSLRNFIFQDRIDITNAAYEDYYVSGDSILIQNTKGRGMQLGSSNDYGNVLLAMRDEGDNKRFLFNEVEVNLQSWNGPDSDMKDYTTDDANIYIEVGTTSYEEQQREIIIDSDLMLFVDTGWADAWSICKRGPNDLTIQELNDFLSLHNNIIVVNGFEYSVIWASEIWDGDDEWRYCNIQLNTYDNLDYNWARNAWMNNKEGYYIMYKEYVTDYVEVLTPQQTKNVWLKRYSDEYVEEWASTQYYCELDEAVVGDYVSYNIYDNNTGDYAYDFIAGLNVGDVIKIGDIEMTVQYPDHDSNEWVRFDYRDDYPRENLWVSIKQRVYVNNPVLKDTIKLTGTNCDYIKIWTQYDENPEQYGRRCIVKGITFNDLKYEYDQNPTFNRNISKKDYWKQISGNGSIKVIDLTGDE